MRRRLLPAMIVAGLCALLIAQATWFRLSKSITFDETYYLGCALQTVHDGWLDPRLAGHGVAPLPVILDYVGPLAATGGESRADPWQGWPQDASLIDGPRLANSILCGAPLIILVFLWLLRRQGVTAAALGAGLLALSPSVIAHSALATADVAFAFFSTLCLAVLAWYLRQPSRRRLIVLAIAIGSAMSAKYSGIYLLPVAGLAMLLRRPDLDESNSPSWWRRARQSARVWLLLFLMVLGTWWGFHLFTFSGPLKTFPLAETPDWSPWVKLLGRGPAARRLMDIAHTRLERPAPVAGLLFQILHNRGGHNAFFMGDHSLTGWWYYFPCAFAFKSTPADLLIAVALLVALAVSLRRPRMAWRRLDVDLQVLMIAIGVYSAILLTSRINIGHRYLLPLYPLLALAGADRLAVWLPPRRAIRIGVPVALLCLQAASAGSIAPHYLAYFNRLAGGSENGWRLLVDSNIDWGQDLPALRHELSRRGDSCVAIAYFGTADPAGYEVEADPVDSLTRDPEDYTVLAISVTVLQGREANGDEPWRDLRGIPPDSRAGHSIFLYDLRDPRAEAVFQSAVNRLENLQSESSSSLNRHPSSLLVP